MTWQAQVRPCLYAVFRPSRSSMRLHGTFHGDGTRVKCSQLLYEPERAVARNESDRYEGQIVLINGVVRSVRKQKRHAFAQISDGSTSRPVQAVLAPEQASSLTMGATIEILGKWTPSLGKGQMHELQTTAVKVLGPSDPQTFPLQKKYQTSEFLRTIPHLRLRTPFNSLLVRIRDQCIFSLATYFRQYKGGQIFQVQPPLVTSSDCEGAGEVFTLEPRDPDPRAAKDKPEHFFREQKYLTVSSQLHLEAYAAEVGSVWTLSPTFRAERSDTPRHLSEFYMLEVEMSYAAQLESIMQLVEELLRAVVEDLCKVDVGKELLAIRRTGESGEDVDKASELEARWKNMTWKEAWPRVSYTEAIKILKNAPEKQAASFRYPPTWDAGLQLEHEKYLVDTIGQGCPVFITDYPKKIKPFYMAPSALDATSSDPDAETVACFDLLLPELCEVVGGSLREHRLPFLLQNMREHNLIKPRAPTDLHSEPYPFLRPDEDLGSLKWYADLRRYGSAPHGGFGLGFDRLLCFLTGVSSVRDMVPFPRYFGRADC